METDYIDIRQAKELIDEKLLVEALCDAVERIQVNDELAQRISSALNRLSRRQEHRMAIIPEMQKAMREIKLDLELVKRALVAIGQTGVMRREQIEAELVREVFPPGQPHAALGVVTVEERPASVASIDCRSRLYLCKAACCRIFSIHLTAREVRSNCYHWSPKQPYTMSKNPHGCSHLKPGTCECTLYADRPQACRTYSCRDDKRIWRDFDEMVLNPALEKRLRNLEVSTGSPGTSSDEGQFDENGGTIRQGPASKPSSPMDVNSPPDFSALRTLIDTAPRERFVPRNDDAVDSEN